MVIDLTEDITLAIDALDGQRLLSILQEASVNMGEYLLALAQERLGQGDVGAAVFLLRLLLPGITDEQSCLQLASSFGQVCVQMGHPAEARACYLAIGIKQELIPLVAETYDDLPGLVSYLAECADSIAGLNPARLVFDKLELLVSRYLQQSEVIAERQGRLNENLALIRQHCHPETSASLSGLQEYLTGSDVVVIDDRVLEKIDGVWCLYSMPEMAALCKKEHFHLELQEILAINCQSVFYLWGCIQGHRVDEPPFFKKGRYVVLDFRTLFSAMTSVSLAPLLRSAFIFNFIDSRTLQASWLRLFNGASSLPPTQCIWLGTENFQEKFQTVLQTLLHDFNQSLAASEQEISRYYEQYTFPSRGHIRVLFLTSRFTTYLQYSVRDLAWGFEKNGHTTLLLKEASWDGEGLRNEYVQSVIATFKPDLVFAIDHLRYEFGFLIPPILPFMSWVQDPLPNIKYLPQSHHWTKQDYVVGYSDGMTELLASLPEYKGCNLSVMPVGVNPTSYYPLSGYSKKYDVSYVTHLIDPVDEILAILAGDEPEGLSDADDQAMMRMVVEELDRISLPELSALLQGDCFDRSAMRVVAERLALAHGVELTDSRFDLLRIHAVDVAKEGHHLTPLGRHAMWLMKVKPIRYLLTHRIDVHVFGRGWENVPGLEDISHPPVANGPDLNRLLNETKINLNYNPSVTMHMKAPEIIAAKGFMLSPRHVRDKLPITHFFEEGKEVILCDDEADLLQKVKYYLQHENACKDIAERASRKLHTSLTIDRIAESFRSTPVA